MQITTWSSLYGVHNEAVKQDLNLNVCEQDKAQVFYGKAWRAH